MATSIETTEHQLPGCKVCAYAEVKRSKPSDGFLDEEECEGMCDEEDCVEDCECGECLCETFCAEAEGDDCLDDCCCAECIEDRMYATRWDSLYFDGLGPTAGFERWKVDYEMCSPKELKRMVQNRGLVDPYPAGTTMKYYYVRTLTEADRRPSTFRFMDLPAEMRNLVYIELLLLPIDRCHKHRSCFPQILRTSHKVHEEAEQLLYTENTIECDFTTDYIVCGPDTYDSTMMVINDKELAQCEVLQHYMCDVMRSLDEVLPSYLRRVHSINVNINVNSGNLPIPDPSYGNDVMRRMILLFASALMDQNCLKNVRIQLEDDGQAEEWPGIAHAIEPLRRLRNVGKVEVLGKISALTASTLASDMEGDSATFNTVKQLQLIYTVAEAYGSLYALIDPVVQSDDDFMYRDSTANEVLSHHMFQLNMSLEADCEIDLFADEQTELDLQVRLAKMQMCLDKVQSESATEQLKTYAAARETRMSYAAAGGQKSIDFQALQRAPTPTPLMDEQDFM